MSAEKSVIPLRSWIVLGAIGILIFLMNIDYTAVNLTLVPISEEINVDLNSLQWLLSGYVLVWAAFVIPAGRFADIYGKQKALITGLLIFMAGSCLTGIGQSIEMLIFGRVLQGFGAAIFTSPAWASIFTLAPPEKQGFVMGLILSSSGLGLATGPTLAGILIEEVSWRWIFYINIPIGILIIAIILIYSAKENLEKVKQKIDYWGALILSSGMTLFIYALNELEVQSTQSLHIWAELVLGVALIIAFILLDRRKVFRTLPPALFKNKAFMAATLGEFFMAFNFSLVLVMMSLYLQNTLRYSSFEAGLVFLSMTISMGVLSPIGGKILDTFGIKGPMIFGSACAGLGFVLLAYLGVHASLLQVCTALFFVGTGLGTYFTACSTAMMRSVPQEDLNVASGVFTMFMMLGNTISVILSTSFVVLFGRTHLLNTLSQQGMVVSPQQHEGLVEIISMVEHTASQLKDFASDQVPLLLNIIDEAFVYGLSINMMIGAGCALVATLFTVWGISAQKNAQGGTHAHVGV
jgi:EmrB/QacA subfamily drug resistance transporter